RAADLRRNLFGSSNNQVFVAMSFDKSLDAAYSNGLKLAIQDCGYKSLRVDATEHNEKICDVMIAEIRRSKFLVADFTGHRNAVYLEGGFMMVLGPQLFFTSGGNKKKNAYFNPRQYNHIEWDNASELRAKLKRRIQATIT